MILKPFYWNFDGLDVTFQGRLPTALLDVLAGAKEHAGEMRKPELVEWNGEAMHVAERGIPGGYAYQCDTGPTGAKWFFSKNQKSANWNIRVSVKSNALASHGLGWMRSEFYRFLEALGAEVGQESISRVDYCMDFLATDVEAAVGAPFRLEPPAFVMHSRMNRADHPEHAEPSEDSAMEVHGVSGRTTSITCGKMPGRQIIIYDKSAEVRRKQKHEWWAHWNTARAQQGLPSLTEKERVWRVELRAGKDHLKDRWGITTWADLDKKLGDVFTNALTCVRYTIQRATDTERFRWRNHPIWDAAARTISADLKDMASGAEPGVVKTIKREHLAGIIEAQITGLLATYTVATGIAPNATGVANELTRMAKRHIQIEREEFLRKRKNSEKRYKFIAQA